MIPAVADHIEITLEVSGGRPRITGHRIRVQDVVVWHEHLGMSPDEIVAQYPGLTLADVYAALARYHDHLDEIRRDIAADQELVKASRVGARSKLLDRLTGGDGGTDTLPSR